MPYLLTFSHNISLAVISVLCVELLSHCPCIPALNPPSWASTLFTAECRAFVAPEAVLIPSSGRMTCFPLMLFTMMSQNYGWEDFYTPSVKMGPDWISSPSIFYAFCRSLGAYRNCCRELPWAQDGISLRKKSAKLVESSPRPIC